MGIHVQWCDISHHLTLFLQFKSFHIGDCFCFFFSCCVDFLCSLGSDLPQRTTELLYHRNPEGHAAEILRLALCAQHGTA